MGKNDNKKITLTLTLEREQWQAIIEALMAYCVETHKRADDWEKAQGQDYYETLDNPNPWRRTWDICSRLWGILYRKVKQAEAAAEAEEEGKK